jgi:hypothetical protein
VANLFYLKRVFSAGGDEVRGGGPVHDQQQGRLLHGHHQALQGAGEFILSVLIEALAGDLPCLRCAAFPFPSAGLAVYRLSRATALIAFSERRRRRRRQVAAADPNLTASAFSGLPFVVQAKLEVSSPHVRQPRPHHPNYYRHQLP